mmetsp:Transcript_21627/g.55646  ORF Transcript_21627/g.55646 Transcript_21627/m.55646 type:complete len:208 (-) Transcript_21627:1040-1663(-)
MRQLSGTDCQSTLLSVRAPPCPAEAVHQLGVKSSAHATSALACRVHVVRVGRALARVRPRSARHRLVLAARPTKRRGRGLAREGLARVEVRLVPDPLVRAPLGILLALAAWRARAVQRALVQPAVGQHRIEKRDVALDGFHGDATVAVVVVTVPRVVLGAVGIESARKVSLATLPHRAQVHVHCGCAVARAVLDTFQHVRLGMVVVR